MGAEVMVHKHWDITRRDGRVSQNCLVCGFLGACKNSQILGQGCQESLGGWINGPSFGHLCEEICNPPCPKMCWWGWSLNPSPKTPGKNGNSLCNIRAYRHIPKHCDWPVAQGTHSCHLHDQEPSIPDWVQDMQQAVYWWDREHLPQWP